MSDILAINLTKLEITDIRRALVYTAKGIDANLERSSADKLLADRLEALDDKLKTL